MKNAFIIIALVCTLFNINAQQIEVADAKTAAENYLGVVEPTQSLSQLTLYQTLDDNNGNAVMYIFNIGNEAFIATGADINYDPVVGYSFNGAYDSVLSPDNLRGWLSNYVTDVTAMKADAPKDNNTAKYHADCKKRWKDLIGGNTGQLSTKAAKGVEELLETRWNQGPGYNNYCPVYNGSHCVTGCVATAMAQIIRYHRYPSSGFSRFGYNHYYHGYQYAPFDSVEYDYRRMPSSVNGYSTQISQHNVSLLCYHCGVAVKMNYENPTHTTGSGAYSHDVPDALKYFGYTNAFYMGKPGNNTLWDSLLRNDLDQHHPVYYSGSSDEGGHAFVCDGYREDGTYHFNFGWGGAGNGFFTLSHVGGYSTNQAAVFNIVPSNFTALHDTIYVASDGEGGGSSWEDANPNLQDAIVLASLYGNKKIWVKQGTYPGNTSSPYSFTMCKNVTIYGGFDGTETSLEQRNPNNQSIMSGGGVRKVLYSSDMVTNSAMYNMTLADGYAESGSASEIFSGLRLEQCTIENNTTTNGAALQANFTTVYNCIVHNNNGGGMYLNSSSLRNSLVVHNSGYGLQLESSSIDGCDVVCNSGTGIINDNAERIRNTVIWRNGIQLSNTSLNNIFFCAIEGIGEKDSNSNFGLVGENRPETGVGPIFMDPDVTVGPSATLGDWRISNRSPLVDAGDSVRSGSYKYDLDGLTRCRNGRTDIGCYEWIPGNAVQEVATKGIRVYPNPATSYIKVEGLHGHAVIYDLMGRCVRTLNLNGEPATIDINGLPKGLYLIRTDDTTLKFVISER